MPLIRLKKATPGNIVLIDFSSKHEIGKSSEKRVNPLRQIVGRNTLIIALFGYFNYFLRVWNAILYSFSSKNNNIKKCKCLLLDLFSLSFTKTYPKT